MAAAPESARAAAVAVVVMEGVETDREVLAVEVRAVAQRAAEGMAAAVVVAQAKVVVRAVAPVVVVWAAVGWGR